MQSIKTVRPRRQWWLVRGWLALMDSRALAAAAALAAVAGVQFVQQRVELRQLFAVVAINSKIHCFGSIIEIFAIIVLMVVQF